MITKLSISTDEISVTEVMAAFRKSSITAEREGFYRKAAECDGYVNTLDSMFVALRDLGVQGSIKATITFSEDR